MADVVAFGPSLVDVSTKLPDDRYVACHRLLGIKAGSSRRFDDYGQVRELIAALTGCLVEPGGELQAVVRDANLSLAAGSTTLGMLSAMPEEFRTRSTFVSVLGRVGPRLDPLSTLFAQAVAATGIQHELSVADGHNPVGFVLSGTNHPEKTLAMYPGVANVFGGCDLRRLSPELVLVDAYELAYGQLGAFLHGVIESAAAKVGFSLGNHSILTGQLRRRIRSYILNRKLHVLRGNAKEYQTLFPELDARLATPAGFWDHPVRRYVPFALMTFGARGMAAHWAGAFASAVGKKLDPAQIINTSGAGDAAAGVFCAGVLHSDGADKALRRAVDLAARVLHVSSSRILA